MKKERKRAIHELLLPESYRDVRAAEDEPWDQEEYNEMTRNEPDGRKAFILRTHEQRRAAQIKSLASLFQPEDPSKFVVTDLEILGAFPMLYQGWECDAWGYTVMYQRKRYVLGTDHGGPSFMDDDQLRKKMEEYIRVAADTVKAREFLEGK